MLLDAGPSRCALLGVLLDPVEPSWAAGALLATAAGPWPPSMPRAGPAGFWSDLFRFRCSLTPAPDLAEPGALGLFLALALRFYPCVAEPDSCSTCGDCIFLYWWWLPARAWFWLPYLLFAESRLLYFGPWLSLFWFWVVNCGPDGPTLPPRFKILCWGWCPPVVEFALPAERSRTLSLWECIVRFVFKLLLF